MSRTQMPITAVSARAFKIPTDAPESDGTLQWDATTMVLVQVEAAGHTGLGYTYAPAAVAAFIKDKLTPVVKGLDAFDIPAAFVAMARAVRNAGRPGMSSYALSAVDNALWDLKGKILDLCVADLLGRARQEIRFYGSGGFTSYTDQQLSDQLGGWAAEGFGMVKMKIGREPERDAHRLQIARDAIGPDCQLFVDANGAFSAKQALKAAEQMTRFSVSWFEEPVSSDNLAGLRMMRDRGPAGMDISAGEYGCDPWYFRHMLEAQAVDTLQADATRCGGLTGFLQVAALVDAYELPLSSHCAPALHQHVLVAAPRAVHGEWFYDHARIEHLLFEGAPVPRNGAVSPDRSRPGLGLALKPSEAARYEL